MNIPNLLWAVYLPLRRLRKQQQNIPKCEIVVHKVNINIAYTLQYFLKGWLTQLFHLNKDWNTKMEGLKGWNGN